MGIDLADKVISNTEFTKKLVNGLLKNTSSLEAIHAGRLTLMEIAHQNYQEQIHKDVMTFFLDREFDKAQETLGNWDVENKKYFDILRQIKEQHKDLFDKPSCWNCCSDKPGARGSSEGTADAGDKKSKTCLEILYEK